MSVTDLTWHRPAPPSTGGISADPLPPPTLNALISYALAEATWAEQAIHPTMTGTLREHHQQYAHMHLAIALRLKELKDKLVS